jgi:molybdenum cofactor synthesis domain-containing protein
MSAGAARIVESAAALVIGGEILSGKIRDENSHQLALTLRALGIRLERISVVPDDTRRIADELVRLMASADVVLTSGGVGPTHDDVTIDAVALALGVDVIEDESMLALLRSYHGAEPSDAQRRLARLPVGARLMATDDVRWPTIVADKVWLLPGIPELFRLKLAVVREHLRGPLPFFTETLLLRADEADIKVELDRVVAAHPRVEIGSYPKWFDPRYKTKITFDSRNLEDSRAAAAALRELLLGRIVEDA